MKPIRLVTGFLTVGVWTLLSRVFGFARDMMVAAYLGSGPVAEAFLIAFSLPNMFRRFFAEGAFNTAFVPLFSKKLESGDNPQGFAQDAFAGLASFLILFTLIASFAMPWLVLAMASGFSGDVRFDLAVDFGRIAFVYILFISLAAMLSGVLNATGRFVAAAAAPVLLNVLLVAAIGLGAMTTPAATTLEGVTADSLHIGRWMTWAVPVAGVAQLALVWWAAARAGFRMRLSRPRLTPDLKRLAVIAAPAMLAGGVVQINLLVGRQVASFFDGAIAWLSYADRLYQLPLGVVGIAIGVVLLPELSRRLQAGDAQGGRDALSRAAEMSMVLTVPSAIALIVIAVPIVGVIYGRGEFGASDVTATALAVAVYGAGLPAFVLQKVWQPLYFAREDTRTPFRFALVAMVVNAAVAIGLAATIGFIGAAIGTTVAAWVMVWLLVRGAREMGDEARIDAQCRRRLPRIVLAALIMGAVLWALALWLEPMLAERGLRWGALLGLVLAGIVTYFATAQAIGAVSFGELRRTLRR
jgi:putative peptidoglycan lipid II flippase